ncbi:hypothetical protein BA190_10135 [Labrys sp. WJW]|uniref:head decoration protein n=1 Tax=Labrys sp. WJW TaxID=1737983 RepID=UPI0008345340|nr:head decoration protein [Labrys sp. WJW]OCC05252.1 hypothetical protein BA190_10135 [Labrys sp. WJW]
MPVKTEGRHAGEFLLSEADGAYSRDNIKLLAGSGSLPSGRILGKVTATGKFKPHDPAASDGSQDASAILLDNANVPADADLTVAGITRQAEVKVAALTFAAATDTQPEKDAVIAQLAAHGIIGR